MNLPRLREAQRAGATLGLGTCVSVSLEYIGPGSSALCEDHSCPSGWASPALFRDLMLELGCPPPPALRHLDSDPEVPLDLAFSGLQTGLNSTPGPSWVSSL